MKEKDKQTKNKASSLLEKLKKNSQSKRVELLSESIILVEKDTATTPVPLINVALQGTIDGGIGAGITTIAGPSKHFKTSFGLVMVAGFLNKYEDGVCLFYNNEFGAKKSYFEAYGVDTDRVIHTPFTNIEDLKFDMMKQLSELEEKENVIIFIDSIGNAASKKEVEDALAEKSAADMTRAKQLKSLFRMITPELYLKNIPLIAINHTYQTQEMFSKTVVSGGQGAIYSSDSIFVIGKNQLKESEEITGSKFIITIEKSRFVKERSKLPITVRWGSGIAKWSGFEDLAEEWGVITKCRVGRSLGYQYDSIKDGVIQSKATDIDSDDAFWTRVLEETDLKERIEREYKIGKPKKLELEILEDEEPEE